MAKKNLQTSDPEFSETLIQTLENSRSYRKLHLPRATLQELILHAEAQSNDPRQIDHIVREKLHQIVAPYLGDPDYSNLQTELDDAYRSGSDEIVKQTCLKILSTHASTRERLPILDQFYARIFAQTGTPHVILDLACGLNPFALPWMGLPQDVSYYAYDLHQPRVAAINHFFTLNHMPELGVHQDILVDPPQIEADAAFFFKEAHRFEQRQHNCNRAFWQALKVKTLLVSLPTRNLTGSHSKIDQHRRLVMNTIAGLPWKVQEIEFKNEIVFCIEKSK